MNHSSSVGASIPTTCEAIIMSKPVDKIIGQPTTKTTDILEQQLAQAAGAIPTNQWGGTLGCITLVLNQESFRETIGILDGKVDRQAKLALVHSGINRDYTPYDRMAKHEDQKEIILDFNMQESVDHLLIPYRPYRWERQSPIPRST